MKLSAFVTAVIVLLMVACSSVDPLTQYINKHGFEQIFPPTSRATVGDVYESEYLTGQPTELLENILTQSEREELMASIARDITLMNTEHGAQYKVHAEIFIIGYLNAALANEGITYFRINAGNATEYLLSHGYFERIVLPKLQAKHKNINGAYIYSLLEVSSLEYEFYNQNGAKVQLSSGDKVSNAFQAKGGVEWKVNSRGNIEISTPRFVGYKAKRISTSAATSSNSENVSLIDVKNKVNNLIAQLRGMNFDNYKAGLIIREIPRFGRKISADDFIRILNAASLVKDNFMSDVIVRCASYIEYPISDQQTHQILRNFVFDNYRSHAANALSRAAEKK